MKYWYSIKINARITNIHDKQSEQQKIKIYIPGGPQISGKYWDEFAFTNAEESEEGAIVLNLKNHDESYDSGSSTQVKDYVEHLSFQLNAIFERYKTQPIDIIAHSFGGILFHEAVDSLNLPTDKVVRIFFVSSPFNMNLGERFLNDLGSFLENLNLSDEESFKIFWRKIIPLYLEPKFEDTEVSQRLESAPTFYVGNPDIDKSLLRSPAVDFEQNVTVTVIDGTKDRLISENNFNMYKSAFKKSNSLIVEGGDHFLMLSRPQELWEAIK